MAKRLLLIDDDIGPNPAEAGGGEVSYMWYYTQALREAGYELTEVNNTDRALQELAGPPFDLILLDVMMAPRAALAGADTARGLRSGLVLADLVAKAQPQVPVVILTNVEDAATLQALRRRSNVKAILSKIDFAPFAVADEVAKILEV